MVFLWPEMSRFTLYPSLNGGVESLLSPLPEKSTRWIYRDVVIDDE